MKPSSLVIGLLVFLLVSLTIFSIIGDFNQYYSPSDNVNVSILDKYNYSTSIDSDVQGLASDIKNVGEAEGLLGGLVSGGIVFFSAVKNAIVLPIKSVSFVYTILLDYSGEIGVPQGITSLLLIIFTVSVIFSIISILQRYRT